MNDIYTKQNKEYLLMLQYSQRKHYDMAENIQYLMWISIILSIVIGNNSMISSFWGENIVKVISGILAVFYIFFRLKLNKNVEIGAYTKEVIDCTLFGFDIKKNLKSFTEDKLNEFAIRKKVKNESEYLCQINNTGKDNPRGVKNWYEDRQQMDMKKAIYESQKENIWWDEKLSKIYIGIFVIVSLAILSVIFIINRNQSIEFLLFTLLIPLVPILSEIKMQVECWIKLKVYMGKVEIVCKRIEKNINNINKEDLEELQNLILERRLYKFLIPNKLHSIVSKKFHELREAMKQANSINDINR